MSSQQNTRPVNARELSFLHKFNTRLSRFLNDMDELKNTVIYRHELKKTGNHFLSQLEKLAAQYIWRKDLTEEDIQGAMNDFSNILDFAENMEMVAMGLEYVNDKRMAMFWTDMGKLFKKHGLPLEMKDGVVTYSGEVGKRTMNETSHESKAAA